MMHAPIFSHPNTNHPPFTVAVRLHSPHKLTGDRRGEAVQIERFQFKQFSLSQGPRCW
jgi:hypothetical protein